MSDQTLMGKKLKVYAMLKILKYCTDSPARSYQLKFALNMVLRYFLDGFQLGFMLEALTLVDVSLTPPKAQTDTHTHTANI